MELRRLSIPGCVELRPSVLQDERGSFVKPFQESMFRSAGLPVDFPERYYSTSHQGVIRGLHFQVPPRQHHKLVYCVAGRVLDVMVDLRQGSPSFGEVAAIELNDQQWNALFLPVGLAHGFACLSEVAVMAYSVGSEYLPAADTGVRWDSIDFDWPITDPVVSARDRSLPALGTYDSPFRFEP